MLSKHLSIHLFIHHRLGGNCMSLASLNFLLFYLQTQSSPQTLFIDPSPIFFPSKWLEPSSEVFIPHCSLFSFLMPMSCLMNFQSSDLFKVPFIFSLLCIPQPFSGFGQYALSSLPCQNALLPWFMDHFISSCIHLLIQLFLFCVPLYAVWGAGRRGHFYSRNIQ